MGLKEMNGKITLIGNTNPKNKNNMFEGPTKL